MFSIVVESDSYNNVYEDDVIQYCDILSSNEKKTMNIKLMINLAIKAYTKS